MEIHIKTEGDQVEVKIDGTVSDMAAVLASVCEKSYGLKTALLLAVATMTDNKTISLMLVEEAEEATKRLQDHEYKTVPC